MRRVALNIVSCIALLLTFTFVVVNPAQACSGSGYFPRGTFPISDFLRDWGDNAPPRIIAVGRVQTAGDSSINVVLHVDYYLENPQADGKVLFFQDSLITIHNSLVEGRTYPVRCGSLGYRIEEGRLFIARLVHREDLGSYWGIVMAADEDDLFRFPTQYNRDDVETFTMAGLIDYMVEQIGDEPVAPERYVSPRPVIVDVMTQSGDWYTLPVNQASLVQSESPDTLYCDLYGTNSCTLVVEAPNGLDQVSFYPVGSGAEENNTIDNLYTFQLEGEAGVYSSDSVLFTAWTGNQLRVFVTSARRAFSVGSGYGMEQLTSFTSAPDNPLIAGAGAWSPNGRTFAFSMESGVWLWDALTPDAQPELLLTASDEAIRVRHYSPLGNYLALESGTRRYHLDIASGEEYPDGVFSPDDRRLIAYDTNAEGMRPYTRYLMRPTFTQSSWDRDRLSQFEWLTPHEYIYAGCGDPIYGHDLDGFEEPWCKVIWYSNRFDDVFWVDGTAFDYEPITESLGVVVDADTLWVNGEIIELSGLIDGDIVRVELTPLIDLKHTLLGG